jgi:Kef-type K+ transport system membrane component KefB
MRFADVDLARLLIALAVLLLAAHGVGSLFSRLGQPPAIGEIVGGILLGPSALAAVSPTVQHWIFPASGSSAAALGAVYHLGLLLLMFAAGAEMRRLLQRNAMRTVGLIASFGLVLPSSSGSSPSRVSRKRPACTWGPGSRTRTGSSPSASRSR